MGYTHYWTPPAKVEKKDWEAAIKDIKDIVRRHKDVLAHDYDEPGSKPLVDIKKGIWFNGRGDDGHETFAILLNEASKWDFCKTNMKPYDQAVCETLLVLQARVPGFSVGSDGGPSECSWPAAREAVKQYGIKYSDDGLTVVVDEGDPIAISQDE